jgi:hypothetical protein
VIRASLPRIRAYAPGGRHVRGAIRRAAALGGAAAAAATALIVIAGGFAGAVALVAAVMLVALAVCRVIAAGSADAREERWLRAVLGGLRPHDEDEDSDQDLLVY